MNELERFEKLKKLEYKYNKDTGKVEKNEKVMGSITPKGYITLTIRGKKRKLYQVRAHRYIWWLNYGEVPVVIDHINNIKNDNRLENLRNVDLQKNQFNRKGKGYTKTKNGFKASIRLNNKTINLGYYKTEQEAHNVYLEAKEKYHII